MPHESPSLSGLTIAFFESRMSLPMHKLIEKHGARAIPAPSMREVPIADNRAAFEFYEGLKNRAFDYVVLMTGVGTRTLIEALSTRYPKEEIIKTLLQAKIIVRGPKPKAVCAMHQIPVAVVIPEPNTWQEIRDTLQTLLPPSPLRIAILEYGISNQELIHALKAQSAEVTPVPVYKWALPEDTGPLQKAIRAIINDEVDLAIFTSAQQVDHLLLMSRQMNAELKLRRHLTRVGIFSIGPVCSERLRENQIFPDLEAKPNKMADLVELAALRGREIADTKKKRIARQWIRVDQIPAQAASESPILRACRREPNTTIPIWFMRQAGRYMAEYQILRRPKPFLEFCKDPDLCCEATITAVERLGVDAAILFSDILVIVESMGFKLDYPESVGPVIANPIRETSDIDRTRPVPDPRNSLAFVMEAITKTRQSMKAHIPLIGFCGAPFTVASYLIEGRSSRPFLHTKKFMREYPDAWKTLMDRITDSSIAYLNAQIDAGCDLVQIFDSWVSALTSEDYEQYALTYSKKLIQGVKGGVPVIHFGTFNSHAFPSQKQAGGHVLSVDWRTNIKDAWDDLGPDIGVQGNLDPTLLFCSPEVFLKKTGQILRDVGNRPGFIFNLGHGILPETPMDHVMRLVDFVHEWKP